MTRGGAAPVVPGRRWIAVDPGRRAADLGGVDVASAQAGLDELVHAGLRPPPDATGRHRFDDLVRIYATTSTPIGAPLSR